MRTGDQDRIARYVSIASFLVLLAIGSFFYGGYSATRKWAPWPLIQSTKTQIKELFQPSDAILETKSLRYDIPVATLQPERIDDRLLLVAGDVERRRTVVRVIDRTGRTIAEYPTLFENIWPNGEGEFANGRPAKDMYIHGLAMLPDASIVANLAHASTFRMDVCGEVRFRLENLGHHSVHLNDDGTLWVGAEEYFAEGPVPYQFHRAPFRSWVLQKIDAEGETIVRIPLVDLLYENGLEGLIYQTSIDAGTVNVTGDTLHLNDIESFPDDLEPGFFGEGDVLISLRHGGVVLVFEESGRKVKFVSQGRFFAQHDPDFVSGDTIHVFNNRSRDDQGKQVSRILSLTAPDGRIEPVFEPAPEHDFFTAIMGKHQVLDNGDSLVVEALGGRLLQFDRDGELVWRWSNRTGPERNNAVYDGILLPADMDEAFFRAARERCTG